MWGMQSRQCHGNLNSRKISYLSGQTLLLEDIAGATLVSSALGTVVMTLFDDLFTAPSWRTCTLLAWGGAWATDRHTSTTYGGLTGATTVKHFSRCSVFLGCPLYNQRGRRWSAVIRLAVQFVPAGQVIRVSCDDTPKQTVGRHLAGRERYRPGAGSARQEDRTLRGLHCVLGIMPLPLTRWPGPYRSVPVGCARSLKAPPAPPLNGPYQSRRQWARALLDCGAAQGPGRPIRGRADGGEATQDYGRQGPQAPPGVGRFPSRATLYEWPPPPPAKRRGA